MGTDNDSITNLPEIVEILRKGDHNPVLPSQIKLIVDNACSRRDIYSIYDVLLKWFEKDVQRVAMARPKDLAIH